MSGDPLLVVATCYEEKGQTNAILTHFLTAVVALDAIWQARLIRGHAGGVYPESPVLAADFTTLTNDRAVSYRALLHQALLYPTHGLAAVLPSLSHGTRSLQMLTCLAQTAIPCHDLGIIGQDTSDSTVVLTTARPNQENLEIIKTSVSHNLARIRMINSGRAKYHDLNSFTSRLYDLLGIPEASIPAIVRGYGSPDDAVSDVSNAPDGRSLRDTDESTARHLVPIRDTAPYFSVQASAFKLFIRSAYGNDTPRIFLTTTVGVDGIRKAIADAIVLPDRFGHRFMRLLALTLSDMNRAGELCPYSYQGLTVDLTHSNPYVFRKGVDQYIAYDAVVPVLCDGLLRSHGGAYGGRRHVVYAPARILFAPMNPESEVMAEDRFKSPRGGFAKRIREEIGYLTENCAISEIHFMPSAGRAASRLYSGSQSRITLYDSPDLVASYPVSFFSALAIGSDIVDRAASWAEEPLTQYPRNVSSALPKFDCGVDGDIHGDAIDIGITGPLSTLLVKTIYGTYDVDPDREEYAIDRRIFAPCLGPTPRTALVGRGADLPSIYALLRTTYFIDDKERTSSIAYITNEDTEIGGFPVVFSGDAAPYVMTTNALLKACEGQDDEFVQGKASILGRIWHEYAILSFLDKTGWSSSVEGPKAAFPIPADLIPGAQLDYGRARDLFGGSDMIVPLAGIKLPNISRVYGDDGGRVDKIEKGLALIHEAISAAPLASDYGQSRILKEYVKLYGYTDENPTNSIRHFTALVRALMTPRTRSPTKFFPGINIMDLELRPKARARVTVVTKYNMPDASILNRGIKSPGTAAEAFEDPQAYPNPQTRELRPRLAKAGDQVLAADTRRDLRASLAVLTFGLIAPRMATHLHLTANLTGQCSDPIYQAKIKLFSSTFDAYLSAPLAYGKPSREAFLTELFQIVQTEFAKTLQGHLELVRALLENQSDLEAAVPNAPIDGIITSFKVAPIRLFENCASTLTVAIGRHIPLWSFPEKAIREWRVIIIEATSASQDIKNVFSAYPGHPFLYPASHAVLLQHCARKCALAASVCYEMAVYALRCLNFGSTLEAMILAFPGSTAADYVAYPATAKSWIPSMMRLEYGISPIHSNIIGGREAYMANFSILSIASSALPAVIFPQVLATAF
jgi:hypothetical protein